MCLKPVEKEKSSVQGVVLHSRQSIELLGKQYMSERNDKHRKLLKCELRKLHHAKSVTSTDVTDSMQRVIDVVKAVNLPRYLIRFCEDAMDGYEKIMKKHNISAHEHPKEMSLRMLQANALEQTAACHNPWLHPFDLFEVATTMYAHQDGMCRVYWNNYNALLHIKVKDFIKHANKKSMDRNGKIIARRAHKKLISLAIKRGDGVPVSVLKSYPTLYDKYRIKNKKLLKAMKKKVHDAAAVYKVQAADLKGSLDIQKRKIEKLPKRDWSEAKKQKKLLLYSNNVAELELQIASCIVAMKRIKYFGIKIPQNAYIMMQVISTSEMLPIDLHGWNQISKSMRTKNSPFYNTWYIGDSDIPFQHARLLDYFRSNNFNKEYAIPELLSVSRVEDLIKKGTICNE